MTMKTLISAQNCLPTESAYSGLQMYTSHVGAILVIAHPARAKTSIAPTEKKLHASENRYNTSNGPEQFAYRLLRGCDIPNRGFREVPGLDLLRANLGQHPALVILEELALLRVWAGEDFSQRLQRQTEGTVSL